MLSSCKVVIFGKRVNHSNEHACYWWFKDVWRRQREGGGSEKGKDPPAQTIFRYVSDNFAQNWKHVFFEAMYQTVGLKRFSFHWLYVIILSRKSFRVNLHSIVCLNVNWSVWLNGWVFVYQLSGCGFEPLCCDSYFIILIWKGGTTP